MHTTTALQGEDQQQRTDRFSDWYDDYVRCEGTEPTVITVHHIIDEFGGPEEGGWWFHRGYPVENICIFSRSQAIKELLRLHEKYEAEKYAEEEYDIGLSTRVGKYYPVQRPHFE